ncbi:MAG: hypothetical protein PHI63_01545 [Patescibacteria group bacterium]|nr:hypothetical protein [Patescibacteria group bacterium]
MSWQIAAITALFGGVLPLLYSAIDGALFAHPKKDPTLKLTYFRHWAVCIGDGLLLPVVNGIIWDHLEWEPWYRTAALFVTAVIVTWRFHRLWWPNPKDPAFGLHFLDHHASGSNVSYWWHDLSPAGWAHIAFMSVQLTILGLYVLSPAPPSVIWWTGAILAVFPVVAVLETSWVVNHRIDRLAVLSAISIWLATAVVTAIKLM